jgi:hypothetical protein
MTLADRGTRGGYLDPVILADVIEGTVIEVTPDEGDNFKIELGDSASIDAFGRLRVAAPFTTFDSKQIWNDPDLSDDAENFPLFFDNQELSGSGTSTTFNVNRASTSLGVSANTAGRRVRQTKQRFNYQPGKSQLAIFTVNPHGPVLGVRKEIGYYDDDNGLIFRIKENGQLAVVVRTSTSGSPVDNEILQSQFNLDKLDGTGPSGIVGNPNAAIILFIDFEWLGAGRIRFGIFREGRPLYFHQVLNAGLNDTVYMSNPNLPYRCEIENDGTGAATTVECICTTVINEGGLNPNGILRFADIGATSAEDITAGTIGNAYAICGIRLKPGYLSAGVKEVLISVIENSQPAVKPFSWKLHLNPTLTTGLTYSNVPNSAVQFGVGLPGGDVITNEGTVMGGGYQARADANAIISLESALRIGSFIDGTPDELILSGTPITINQVYFGGMQWRELW